MPDRDKRTWSTPELLRRTEELEGGVNLSTDGDTVGGGSYKTAAS